MCRWNPDIKNTRRGCRHGHLRHEVLENEVVPSEPPVIWCNVCWTVCAFSSSQKVYRGLRGLLIDLFYSPVQETGEQVQPSSDNAYPEPPSIQRYQTFRAFNEARYPDGYPETPGPVEAQRKPSVSSHPPNTPAKTSYTSHSSAQGKTSFHSSEAHAMPNVQSNTLYSSYPLPTQAKSPQLDYSTNMQVKTSSPYTGYSGVNTSETPYTGYFSTAISDTQAGAAYPGHQISATVPQDPSYSYSTRNNVQQTGYLPDTRPLLDTPAPTQYSSYSRPPATTPYSTVPSSAQTQYHIPYTTSPLDTQTQNPYIASPPDAQARTPYIASPPATQARTPYTAYPSDVQSRTPYAAYLPGNQALTPPETQTRPAYPNIASNINMQTSAAYANYLQDRRNQIPRSDRHANIPSRPSPQGASSPSVRGNASRSKNSSGSRSQVPPASRSDSRSKAAVHGYSPDVQALLSNQASGRYTNYSPYSITRKVS